MKTLIVLIALVVVGIFFWRFLLPPQALNVTSEPSTEMPVPDASGTVLEGTVVPGEPEDAAAI